MSDEDEDNGPSLLPPQMARGAGVVRDLLKFSQPFVKAGFKSANQASNAGFAISRKALQLSAGVAGAPGSLDAIDAIVAAAQEVTTQSLNLSENITTGSMDVTDSVLHVAGGRSGETIKLLEEAVEKQRGSANFPTREAMLGVARLLGELTPLLEATPLTLIAGARSLTEIQRQQRLERIAQLGPAEPLDLDPVRLKALKRNIKFAVAIYGSAALHFLGAFNHDVTMPKTKITSNLLGLEALTGVKEKDVILYEKKGKMYRPAHLVAVDHASKVVVISIRGTLSVYDILVDLVCQQEEFTTVSSEGHMVKGNVHRGFLLAAKCLAEKLHVPVSAALAAHPSYDLHVVGHSLGAGVATVLTLLWAPLPLFQARNIQAFAFASPCSLCEELSQSPFSIGHVTSVVLGDDIVARLGLSSFKDTQAALIALSAFKSSEQNREIYDALEKAPNSEKLFPAGTVLHLESAEYKGVPMVVDPVEKFNYIELSSKMFSVHTPEKYLNAVATL